MPDRRDDFLHVSGPMNRELLDKWCERGILWLVLAILVFGPLAFGAVRTQEFLVIEGLTLGGMLLWAARLWLVPHPRLLWPPICWVVVMFAAYAIARHATSDIEYVARKEMIRVLIYAFLFLVILNNLHRQEFTQLIVLTLIFLAMAISFLAIYQFVTGSDKVWAFIKPYAKRGSGTYTSPNNLAGFLEMILPLGLAWLLVSRAKPVLKVFVGYAALVILAGIAVTVSRGAWISTGLTLAVFFAILLLNRTYWLPSAVLLAVIVGCGFYFIPRTHFFRLRFEKMTSDSSLPTDVRYGLWKPALQLWQENVWWGIGPGHFNYRFRAFRPETIQLDPNRVHNDYINTLTDWGIAGVALVASAWALFYGGVFRTWRYVRGSPDDFGSRKSNRFALVLGASLGLLTILLHSIVDFNMHVPANAILAVTLMALVTSCLRFATERHWHTARVLSKVTLTVALAAGLVFLGGQMARAAKECFWLGRAQRVPIYSSAQAAALEKALAAEPMNFETAYALGEVFRVQSMEGATDYLELAGKAMAFYERSMELNPYHGYSWMRYGMCLDWTDRQSEAGRYFDRAAQLDPNGSFTAAHVGWHYVQLENYAAAREWFERSLRLEWRDNLIADSYLKICVQKMLENATNTATSRPTTGFSRPANAPDSR
jgi:O-antigen ligase